MEAPQGSSSAQAVVSGPESPPSAFSPPPLSPASAAAARWNPTREQTAVLEGLFAHGLHTPTAEQIGHIAARLREHGPVENKNVFYWFQNNKARRQQRQKQESFAHFTRMLRRPPPLPVIIARPPGAGQPAYPLAPPTQAPPTAACTNGGAAATHVTYRTPYYMPAPAPVPAPAANAAGGYYNLQHAAAQMAVVYPTVEIAQDNQMQMHPAGMHYQQAAASSYGTSSSKPLYVVPAPANGRRVTLELFPLRPTFLRPDAARGTALTLSTPAAAPASVVCGELETDIQLVGSPKNPNVGALPFYDFLGLQASAAGR